jgi:hypothetical protein
MPVGLLKLTVQSRTGTPRSVAHSFFVRLKNPEPALNPEP